jgi:uncharacterized protein (TIRG00374 family)
MAAEEKRSGKSGFGKGLAVKIIISAVLLYLVLSYVDYRTIPGIVLNSNPFYLLLGLLVGFIFNLSKAFKWRVLASRSVDISYRDALYSYLIGWGLGLFTPARVGEVSRCIYFKPGVRVKLAGLVILDRFFDLLVVVFFSTISLAYLLGFKAIILAGVIPLLLLIAVPFSRAGGLVARRISLLNKLKVFSELIEGLSVVRVRDKLVLAVLTFISYSILVLQAHFILLAFMQVSLFKTFIGYNLTVLSNVLPVTLGGLGMRELISISVFPRLGVPQETAFNLAFLIFIFSALLPAVAGWFVFMGFKSKSGLNTDL